jgi:CheY-like chemotaxis protein
MPPGGRVLLIDDDDLWRKVVRLMLVTAGYDVQEASDGLLGMRAYQQQRSDVVITDIVMPNMEGLETILALGRIDPHVKIIAMSASGEAPLGHLHVALRLGARRILHKPFTRDEILIAITEVLATD